VALAIAAERPRVSVTAVDREPAAVALAAANARRLKASRVTVVCSDWFAALAPAERYDVMVSNPPYLADDDPHLAGDGVCREPRAALVAGDDGLAALASLIDAAPDRLCPGGWLLLEHGAEQGAAVRERLHRRGFVGVDTARDLAGLERVTRGQWPC
jgi:release factor glutamine methyltransferase